MKIQSCRFVCSAYRVEDEPGEPGPDVVFLGRSNVGKSSLINRLVGTKGMARTSSQPGRTQSVNFYRINESWNMVDLPGYGYAKVPLAVRESWKPMVEGLLRRRHERVALGMLVVDARHAPARLDLTMRDWLVDGGFDYLIVGTKADKLSGNGRARATRTLRETIGASPRGEPILVSATTGLGTQTLWSHLDDALTGVGAGGEK